MGKAKVAVMMSTYNGQAYLKEQIESINNQESVEVHLFVRDDGSQDATIDILNTQGEGIYLIDNQGKNLGVGNSFMGLVYEAGKEYDYYAFCDQDDIWLPEKLIQAIEKLDKQIQEKPILYCSNQTLVNQEGDIIGERHTKEINTESLQILNSNNVTGCTMVWNRALQVLLLETNRRPSVELLKVRIHDVWVAMVASIVGEIIYDPRSFIHYRQHDNNVVGARKENLYLNWYKKIQDKSKRNGRSLLAKEVVSKFGDLMDLTILADLQDLAGYQNSLQAKWKLIKNKHVFALSEESPLSIKLKIVFNLI